MTELGGNRHATRAETVLLRKQLRADDEAEAALESSRPQAQEALAALKLAPLHALQERDTAHAGHDDIVAREAVLDAPILLVHARFHPLHRLPDELLGQIFIEWKAACPNCNVRASMPPNCSHVCLLAAAVCRWWRDVALGLPELWRGMMVDFGRVQYSNIDRWVAYLDVWRARAGGLPLDLALEGDWEVVPARDERSAPFWTSLKLCFARCRTLYVFVQSFILHRQFCACLDQDAPFLVECHAEIWLLEHFTGRCLPFFRTAPLLRDLSLVNRVGVEWNFQSTFPAVTKATILGSGACGLADLFDRAPNIDTLVVCPGVPASTPADPDFSITSSALRVLDCRLEDLCDEDLVQAMHFPSLRRARLFSQSRPCLPGRLILLFLRHPMRTVEHLTLDGLDVGVLDGLRHTHNVKILHFQCYTDTSTAVLQNLAQPTDTGALICPLLTDLTLPRFAGQYDAAALQAAILSCARARAPVALSFQHFGHASRQVGDDIGDTIAAMLGSPPGPVVG